MYKFFLLLLVATNLLAEETYFEGSLSNLNQKPVPISLTIQEFKNHRDIKIQYQDTSSPSHLTLTKVNELFYQIDWKEHALRNETLFKKDSTTLTNQKETIVITLSGLEFALKLFHPDQSPKLALSVSSLLEELPPGLEIPVSYTLEEAIQRLLDKNPDLLIQKEHVNQAEAEATVTKRNLLPHFRFPSSLGLMSGLGDLVPFLFPTRHLKAKNAKLYFESEKTTMLLTQANMIQALEEQVFNLIKDQSVQQLYQKVYGLLAAKKTILAKNASELNALLLSLKLEMHNIQANIMVEKANIAMMLGIQNPQGIDAINNDFSSPLITQVPPYDIEETIAQAIKLSPELKQMDGFLQVAENQSTSLYFSWFDPQADRDASIGSQLPAMFAGADSKLREIQVKKQKLQLQILQKTDAAVQTHNHIITFYPEFLEGLTLQKNAFEAALANSTLPESKFSDIKSVIEKYLSLETKSLIFMQNFNSAKSKLNRLLFQENYRF